MAHRTARTKSRFVAACVLSRYDDPFYDPDFDPEIPGELEEVIAQPRDSFVDSAKADLKEFFSRESESVFYQRQLQVMFEGKYFHWITVRALSELVQEGILAAAVAPAGNRNNHVL